MTDSSLNMTEEIKNLETSINISNTSSNSKDSEPENLDAIKKYIEEQEQEIRLKYSSPTVDAVSEVDTSISKDDNRHNSDDLKQQVDHSEMTTNEESKQLECSIKAMESQSECSLRNSVTESDNDESSNAADTRLLKPDETIKNLQAITEEVQSCHKCVVVLDPVVTTGSEINKYELSKTVEEDQHDAKCFDTKDDKLKSPINNEDAHSNLSVVNPSTHKLDSLGTTVKSNFEIVSDLEARSELVEKPKLLQDLLNSTNLVERKNENWDESKCINLNVTKEHSEESLAIATSVMDMILTDAEATINKKKVCSALSKQCLIPKVNSSVSLAIGSKVEAKDFSELWYPAQIIEVDCEEMEVLVQYDDQPKKHNEWISISSPRLRPIGSAVSKPSVPATPPPSSAPESVPDFKLEDKQKVTFALGERCLARWRDNRRFIATIQNDLGNGHYEIMFDDGFQWKCTLSRLSKLKDSNKYDYQSLNNYVCSSPTLSPAGEAAGEAAGAAGPTAPAGPGAPLSPGLARVPLYHTHLFDPTRDYLGSKSERREMKRKLNIKEIFNIGQKRKKLSTGDKESKSTPILEKLSAEVKSEPSVAAAAPAGTSPTPAALVLKDQMLEELPVKRRPAVKRKTLAKKKIKLKGKDKDELRDVTEVKSEIPDAVAAIIGTICETEPTTETKLEPLSLETEEWTANDVKSEETKPLDTAIKLEKLDADPVIEEMEIEAEKFDVQDEVKHEEVIDKIKEVITKLEDGINEVEKNETKPVQAIEVAMPEDNDPVKLIDGDRVKPKKSSKVKKSKKLRLMQEKKVKKQVEKVKSKLEKMEQQVEAMRKQILLKTEELESSRRGQTPAGVGDLLPGEWCCRWVDGQPVGAVSEVEFDARPDAPAPAQPPLPRRSVQVEDNRLPPGWTKHMVRRSLGHSAGKWDVVLVSPDNRRIHTKNDMRIYLENNPDESLKPYETALMDFGIHLKLSRRLGWVSSSAEGAPPLPLPSSVLSTSSPLLKRKKLSLKKTDKLNRKRDCRRYLKIKLSRPVLSGAASQGAQSGLETEACADAFPEEETTLDGASIKDGYVYVGSLKVQVIETLLRCPAEGCYKNFRNTTLLKMHIKHYHRELRMAMGVTPKVLDLAYARTRPTDAEMKRLKCEAQQRVIKVKLPRLHKRVEEKNPEKKEVKVEPDLPPCPSPVPDSPIPKPLDSPKLRHALVHKPLKRPRVLLPVRNPEPESAPSEGNAVDAPLIKEEKVESEEAVEPKQEVPDSGPLDFESAIFPHTVAKAAEGRRGARKRKRFARIAKGGGSEDEWAGSEGESRSSCGTPDSKSADAEFCAAPLTPHHAPDTYVFTENGERIKLVHMKREEIINCHCGFREEDGLMVQCELCLCWQHALCHNIQREAEVPEKYTCSICLNPRRGRRRQRFQHDQDRLFEGLLPAGGGGRALEPLRRAHELAGNLLRAADALHAVRVNTHVATKKNHPKLYLWAKDWESLELTFAQEKLNSEYSDLNVVINNLGKENLPVKADDVKQDADSQMSRTPPSKERPEKNGLSDNDVGSPALLSGLLSSPGNVSLDLPISVSELEKLAKSVQEHAAPQPEAAIENSACRARLVRHIQRCHALLDQRLDSIEAQVAELESQDPSLEDDETADFYPRTKQTLQMITRDLDTMEELGIIT